MSQPEPETLRVAVWGRSAVRLADAIEARQPKPALVLDVADGEDAGALVPLAARSDVAVLSTDIRHGFDARLDKALAAAHLAGLPHLVLAVETRGGNEKETQAFEREAATLVDLARAIGFADALAVQVPTDVDGGPDVDRLTTRLGKIAPPPRPIEAPFRMMVDAVEGDGTLRGWVASGSIRRGDRVVAASSARTAQVAAPGHGGDERVLAKAGEAAALRLDPLLDVAPGEMLSAAAERAETCDQFAADILWLGVEPLLPGRAYRMRLGQRQVAASVTRIKHRVEAGSAAPLAALTLRAGDRGRINLSLAEPVAFEPFERNRALAAFTLHEPQSGRAMAAGRIGFALRRAANIHRQAVDVTKAARAAAKAQRPALLWFTGLSGAGKSTIANLVEKRLFALGHHTYLLDGDNVRHGLNRDLGFTAQDRVENIRRVAETAKLMVDAGLITLASFISPFRAERRLARELMAEGEFIEVYVDASLGVAEARDRKDSTPRHGPARSRTSPASTAPTSRRRRPNSTWRPTVAAPKTLRTRSSPISIGPASYGRRSVTAVQSTRATLATASQRMAESASPTASPRAGRRMSGHST